MKKLIRWAACLGLCLALCVCAALAAEGDITVQLDGEALTFTDAVPQVRDQRTYLPFRAVFEAMGAEVDYEGNVITAVRGGKTLTMTVGSAQAAVEENGVTLPIKMDVAPYVDTETWRTYVPVRFAAQALGCTVGWDQKALTAIIIDTEKLVNAATQGKSYTYLEKLSAMNEKYNSGLWDMTATFDGGANALFVPLFSVDGALSGVMADNAQLDLTMTMKLDMDGLLSMASAMGGQTVTAEDKAALAALKTDGVAFTLRGDLTAGKLYMNMDLGASAPAVKGLDPAAWYELDMAALAGQSGMDRNVLTTMSENSDMLGALVASLSATEPTDSSTAYAGFKSQVDALCAAFADEGFTAKGGAYVAAHTIDADGGSTALTLTLTMDGDQVAAYAVDMTATAAADSGLSGATSKVSATMTADGNMTADINVSAGGMVKLTLGMDGSYTPGVTAPVTTLPADATVLPFTDLMGQGGLGVIGGGDGPTSIISTVFPK